MNAYERNGNDTLGIVFVVLPSYLPPLLPLRLTPSFPSLSLSHSYVSVILCFQSVCLIWSYIQS